MSHLFSNWNRCDSIIVGLTHHVWWEHIVWIKTTWRFTKRKKKIICIFWEVHIPLSSWTLCALMAESDMTSSRLSVAWRMILHHYCSDRQAWNQDVDIHKRKKTMSTILGNISRCVRALSLFLCIWCKTPFSTRVISFENEFENKMAGWRSIFLTGLLSHTAMFNHILYFNDIHLNSFLTAIQTADLL